MTLPNVDKPSINDTITDILTDITENCSYLDTEPSAYCVKKLSRLYVTQGSGSETVTIGFQPRAIIVFGNTAYGASSMGYYGPSNFYSNFYRYKQRYLLGGVYSFDQWGLGGGSYCMFIFVSYDNFLLDVYGGVSSVSSTGFTWKWACARNQIGGDHLINVVCLAIK